MTDHQFSAELWEYAPDRPGSWHFVTLPVDVARDLEVEAGPRKGFGSIPVHATVGTTTWRTSVFPEAASGSYVLPVKKGVRMAEGLESGEECVVGVRVDTGAAD